MRLIDADALLKEMDYHFRHLGRAEEVCNMINSLPTLESPRDWTPCAERLPTNERKGIWEEYEVTVCESHYPTCSYDPCDAPYSKEIVTTALFDDEQKIWHICRSKEAINALLKEDDYPLNGDVIVAWRDLPAPYRADDTTGNVKEDAEC